MKILVVSAHDDPQSYVAALHNTALSALERAGHEVHISDLYALEFNPVASKLDFATTSGASQTNYMQEQQRSINTGSGFSPDIKGEMDKITAADMVLFHFPLWWGSPPAIVHGWCDRVLAMGFAWGAGTRYGTGLLKGKRTLAVITACDPASYYESDGMHRASVQQHLYPFLHSTLAFCGFDVLQPIIIHNITAADQSILSEQLERYRAFLSNIDKANNYIYKQ